MSLLGEVVSRLDEQKIHCSLIGGEALERSGGESPLRLRPRTEEVQELDEPSPNHRARRLTLPWAATATRGPRP